MSDLGGLLWFGRVFCYTTPLLIDPPINLHINQFSLSFGTQRSEAITILGEMARCRNNL